MSEERQKLIDTIIDTYPHYPETIRRLATVAAAGFYSEWLIDLNIRLAYLDWWQPARRAIEAGNQENLQQAAEDILRRFLDGEIEL